MIDAATLRAQSQRLQAALTQRRLWPANDNDPPEPPPAISQRLPRVNWSTAQTGSDAAWPPRLIAAAGSCAPDVPAC